MTRALLVIDVQNDYFPNGALPLWQAEEAEARIITAIGKARASGDKVVLVRHVTSASTGLFAAGSFGSAVRPAVIAASGDAATVTKTYADAFQDTDLASHLNGVSDLLVAGMMTQNCVAFTAMSRLADAYTVRVVGDLCTAPLEIVHLIALSALGSKLAVSNAEQVWH